MTHTNPHHDRLDLKMHTLHFTGHECGSMNLATGKPEYCDFDCPTLAEHKVNPPKFLTPEEKEVLALEARLAELKSKAA
jgi:hypothetical protein